MTQTIVGSGVNSPGSETDSGAWAPTLTTTTTPDDPAGNGGASGRSDGQPRLIFETGDGHRITLSYEDVALALLVLTVAVSAWGAVR